MDDLIKGLVENASPPYLANSEWEPGKPVYYSGPYWDKKELEVSLKSLLKGQWLPAGEEVSKFERKFSININNKLFKQLWALSLIHI